MSKYTKYNAVDHKGDAEFKRLLKRKKYLIQDERVIDYNDSPTGKAYIGFSKRPLQKVPKGFGFRGVILQTENRELMQCHICGKFLRKLSNSHLLKHGSDTDTYKERFGLMRSTGLVCDATSYRLEANCRKVQLKNQIKKLDNLKKMSGKLPRKIINKSLKSDEYKNRYGTCDLQTKYRLIEYVKKFKELPNRTNKFGGVALISLLKRRFGSQNNGYKYYGLPVMYRRGSSIELVAPNKKQYFFNYNRDFEREKVYQFMVNNCEVLQ